MNKLEYKYIKEIDKKLLQELFYSVNWNSAKYPNRLHKAIANSHLVISAWDNEELVGLISTISDGYINVFITYLLVKPNYQRLGVGKNLMSETMKQYNAFGRKILTTEDDKEKYYNNFDFQKSGISMFHIDWQNDNIDN